MRLRPPLSRHLRRRGLIAAAALTTFALVGCSRSQPAATVDLNGAVLTNRSGDCAEYVGSFRTTVVDLQRDFSFVSQVTVSPGDRTCRLTANGIPNYDFNDGSGHFADPVAEQSHSLSIPRNPKPADNATDLTMHTYSAIMLNGVVLDELANGCYKPDDPAADASGNVANGCGASVAWRLDPMGKVKFGTDSHNAHTQPGGLYHYHGNPLALFDPLRTDQPSPVIGFAADGFPIFGPLYVDAVSGKILEAKSGYTLKQGLRPASVGSPGGTYDGTYIQDYEFTDAGSLDKCNGMTVDGQYGYYVTNSYPWVMGCYTGSPSLASITFWDFAAKVVTGLGAGMLLTAAFVVFRRKPGRRGSSARVVDALRKELDRSVGSPFSSSSQPSTALPLTN